MFNHEDFIKTLDTKNILDNMKNVPYICITRPFTDPNHEHIASRDIRITQNNKLGKLQCKIYKYRGRVSINFSNCKILF